MSRVPLLALGLLLLPSFVVAGWNPEQVDTADKARTEFLAADEGLARYFDEAYAYVIFNSVGKGAIGIGGAFGEGVVFVEGEPVATSQLKQVNIGFQFGGQAYREVIFFGTKEAYAKFEGGEFELAAQASAVAATEGASANLAYKDGVAIVTMAKGGLMYEASVGGQHLSFKPLTEEELQKLAKHRSKREVQEAKEPEAAGPDEK